MRVRIKSENRSRALAAVVSMCGVLGVATPSVAGPISYSVIEEDEQGRWVERLLGPDEMPPTPTGDAIENYDNWRRPGSPWFGQTVFTGDAVRVGDREVGDDMVLSSYQGGILDSARIGRTNLSTSGTMGNFDLDLRFYDKRTNQLLGEVLVSIIAIPLSPGESVLNFFGIGALRGFNVALSDEIYMTQKFTQVIGIDANDVGQPVGGPITTGASSSFIRDFSTGQLIDLGSPQRNLGMAVWSVVPAPGVCALFAVVGVIAASRR